MMTPVSRRAPFQWNGGEIWPRVNPNALYDYLEIVDSLGATTETLAAIVDAVEIDESIGVAWEITVATDSIEIADSAGAVLTLYASATDVIEISDEAGSMQEALAADDLEIADALEATVYYPSMLADNIEIDEAADAILIVAAFDALEITDSAGVVLTLYVSAADVVEVSDFISDSITSTQRIVVMNLDTGAVSEYLLPVDVTGIAQRNGILYVATADGLYALDAADDDGVAIEWRWRTGLTHLGTDMLKRVIDVNGPGRTDGTVIAQVVTSRDGTKRSDDYQLVETTRDTHRDGVVKVGKGLSSVYWAFGERGTDFAERRELRVSVVSLSRRR